jgi:hypothetical protein
METIHNMNTEIRKLHRDKQVESNQKNEIQARINEESKKLSTKIRYINIKKKEMMFILK